MPAHPLKPAARPLLRVRRPASVIKMERHGCATMRPGCLHPVGVWSQHESREAPQFVLRFPDLGVAGAPVGQLDQVAVVAQRDIVVELVAARRDRDRTVHVAVIGDELDRLVDAENSARYHIGPHAPGGALAVEKVLDLLGVGLKRVHGQRHLLTHPQRNIRLRPMAVIA